MTTVEKLFVQIFERKNSIIQQVKQQTDLYSQHLASKLLIDGVSPPPWLWNPNQSSDAEKVLNKEELISEILLPPVQPAVHFSRAHCSQYSKPVAAGDNGELLIGLTEDIYSYSRGDIGDRLVIAADCHDNNARCTVNSVPEQDLSVNSPQDETEARISNIYSAPDQSLARIQRSRSRQKALKLRHSGKAEAKSHSSRKNVSVSSSARKRWSIFGSEKVDRVNDSQELIEPCYMRHESCTVVESNKGDNRNKEKSAPCCTGKGTRFKNSAEEAVSVVGSLKLDRCSDGIKKSDSTLVQYVEEFSKRGDCVNELPEARSTSYVAADTCREAMAEDCWDHKEKGINNCGCWISQPSSSQQCCSLNGGSGVDVPDHSAKIDICIFSHSGQQFYNGNNSEGTTRASEGLNPDKQRSETTQNDEVLPSISYTSSIAGHRDKVANSNSTQKSLKANEVQSTSSGGAIMLCPGTHNIVDQQRNTEAVNANKLISHDLVKDPLVNSRSNMEYAGSECLVSKPSDCSKHLAPKQLDFDDSEECKFDECLSLSLEDRRPEKSANKAFGIPSDPQRNHSRQPFNNVNCSQETTKPSEGLMLDKPRSETTRNDEVLPRLSYTSRLAGHRDKVADSNSTQKSPKANEVQRTSSGGAIMLCPSTHNIVDQQRNTETVNASELISHDHVRDPFVNSSSNMEYAGSEHLVSKPSSERLKFVAPKQLDFDDSEICNLDERLSPNLEDRRPEKSPEKAFCPPSYPQVTSDDINNNIMPEKQSSAEPQIPTEEAEICRDALESTSEECVNMQLKEYSPHTNEHPILETTQEASDIVFHVQNPNFEHQTDITGSNAFESSDTEDRTNCKEVCRSPPEMKTDEGQNGTEGKAKSISAFNASKRKHLVMDHNMEDNDLVTCGLFEFGLGNYQNDDLVKSKELNFGKKSLPFKIDSLPRPKRRKIEGQESDSCSSPPTSSVQRHYHSQTGHKSLNLEKVGGDVETVLQYSSQMYESTKEEMKQVACELNEEMKPRTKLQIGESTLHSGGLDGHLGSSSSLNLQQIAVPIFSTLANEAARISQECLVEELEMPADDEQDKVQGNMANIEGLACADTILEEKSYLAVDGRLSHYLEQSPYKRDLELAAVDQSLPELEGFIIDSQSEHEEVDISGNHINFDELHLPRASVERASILEQICKSASQQTLSTQLSSFKLRGIHKPYQSVPNGLLECIDLTSISALNEDVNKEVGSNYMDDVSGSLQELSYSDSLPYSGSQYGRDSHNPYVSPVGTLWEKMSLHSGSSGKTLSSNPELTCFPIEEDPNVSEENENVCEISEKIQEDIVLTINNSAKREPLADITEACLNAPTPVAVADYLINVSVNAVTKDSCFKDHIKAKREVGNHSRDESLGKENHILSFGGNGVKKSEASLYSRSSKVTSSCKTNSRKETRKVSEKETKRNNIVSNVTSFIPLVQQKQAAAQCTGKREIKVKALEAAEAAKRLEAKKENERKMRKEALKIERARLEQENLRQMELEKKRKEEERKKKDADIVAKKRQREEEEKKEKERKRKRLEEARQQLRDDGKLRSEKVEKTKQVSVIAGNDNKNKEANNESRSQVLLKEGRDNVPPEHPETKSRSNGFRSHVEEAGSSIEACYTSTNSGDHTKAISTVEKSPKTDVLAVKRIQEKSYEISPYQCSDDEEEEEEEDIPQKKFIPSWTSKSCVALVLPLQQGVDPDTIFPPDSFCSTDEVILPRKAKA